jgi:hypothetical protein
MKEEGENKNSCETEDDVNEEKGVMIRIKRKQEDELIKECNQVIGGGDDKWKGYEEEQEYKKQMNELEQNKEVYQENRKE